MRNLLSKLIGFLTFNPDSGILPSKQSLKYNYYYTYYIAKAPHYLKVKMTSTRAALTTTTSEKRSTCFGLPHSFLPIGLSASSTSRGARVEPRGFARESSLEY